MRARLRFGQAITGSGIALAVSVVAHAALVVVATRHTTPHAHSFASPVAVEVPAPDLLGVDSQAPESAAELTPPQTSHAPVVHREGPTRLAAFLPSAAAESTSEPAAALSVVTTAQPVTPRFTMVVAATTAPASGITATTGRTTTAGAVSNAPIAEASVEIPAKLGAGAAPAYTAQALAAGVESDVPLELVIDANGAVASARALHHVGYGLEEAALRSVRSYRFTPARRAGVSVAVRMRWLMRFQLQ
jgi:protein TonB